MNEKNELLIQLVSKAKKGSQKAFSELCQLKGQSILYFCIQTMGNYQDGEDAAQEVFIRMQKGITGLKQPEAFSVWLHKLILNTCRDLGRKQMENKYNSSIEELGDVFFDENAAFIPQEYLEVAEKKNKLLSIIENLPRNYRLSIVLFYFEELSYAEIAEILETNTKAVSNNLYRAKEIIRKELEKDDDHLGGLVPMSAISGLLMQDAMVKAPLASVNKCIQNSVGQVGSVATGAGASLGTVAAAVAVTAVIAIAGVFGLPILFNQPASIPPSAENPISVVPQQPSVKGETEGGIQDDYGDTFTQPVKQFPQTEAAVAAPIQEPVVIYGKLSGWVYYDLANNRTYDTSKMAPGVVLQLVAESNPDEIVAEYTTSASDNAFVFQEVPQGRYLLKVLLQKGMRFVVDETAVIPDAGNTQVGWGVQNGSKVFEIDAQHTNWSDISIPLNHMLNLSGTVDLDLSQNTIQEELLEKASSKLLSGLTAQLITSTDGVEEVFATATTNEKGNYLFQDIFVDTAQTFQVRITSTQYPSLQITGNTMLANVQPGITQEMETMKLLPLKEEAVPGIQFNFLDGVCGIDCNHENPKNIELIVMDESPVRIHYTVINSESEIVFEGDWEEADIPHILKTIWNSCNENYTGYVEYIIQIKATDIFGNAATCSNSMLISNKTER